MTKYFDKYVKDFKNLCTPAFFYLAISVVLFVVIAVQNFGNTSKYCLGNYECYVPNTFMMFVPGIKADTLLIAVDLEGFEVSTGSACSSGKAEPSAVLVKMGFSKTIANGCLLSRSFCHK